jgi:hypothetical protein
MSSDLSPTVEVLDRLTAEVLRSADDETVRRFHELTMRWSRLAANEIRDRAKLRRTKKRGHTEPPGAGA